MWRYWPFASEPGLSEPMGLRRILQTVFYETTAPLDGRVTPAENRRYVARSLNGAIGWRIWDKAEEKFLTDRQARKINPREPMALSKLIN